MGLRAVAEEQPTARGHSGIKWMNIEWCWHFNNSSQVSQDLYRCQWAWICARNSRLFSGNVMNVSKSMKQQVSYLYKIVFMCIKCIFVFFSNAYFMHTFKGNPWMSVGAAVATAIIIIIIHRLWVFLTNGCTCNKAPCLECLLILKFIANFRRNLYTKAGTQQWKQNWGVRKMLCIDCTSGSQMVQHVS